jgi:hypothetical protein
MQNEECKMKNAELQNESEVSSELCILHFARLISLGV